MPTIVASSNLTIQVDNNLWSLHNGRGDSVPAIVQAQPDGISYRPSFATARHLPPEGRLTGDQITMVVVGWAVEDSSWHLGIMVTPDIAQSRGGRWCGLARWNHYDGESAEQAGRALASTLNKPFRLVPPPDTQADSQDVAAVTAPYAPHAAPPEAPQSPTSLPEVEPVQPVPLMPLPITMGDWMMDEDDSGLIWQRSHNWHRRQLANGIFLVLLTLAFGALSLGAVFSVFAPPQPDWLPVIGIVLTVLMFILSIRQFFTLSRASTILIDNQQRLVRVVRGYGRDRNGLLRASRTLVQSPYEGLDYVLVSHVLGRRDVGNPYDRISLEAWIHLFSPRRGFINICYINQSDGRSIAGQSFEVRRPLDLHEINTPIHHAALYVAEMVGIPAYVEGR